LRNILSEVEQQVLANRELPENASLSIKELRRMFDQESSKMNQAIFNDVPDQVRASTLRTVAILVELLVKS
jgi:hypothetical protein